MCLVIVAHYLSFLMIIKCDFFVIREMLTKLMHCRARRRFSRGLRRKPMALVKKLRKAKKEAPPNEKPEVVKTHLRNMIIVPEMVGSIVGVYNGKTFNQVEIKVNSLSLFYLCVSAFRKLYFFFFSSKLIFFKFSSFSARNDWPLSRRV